MDDLLKGVGAAVAVVASLSAVALAVEQLTLRARLRKTEEWAVTMLAHDQSEERKAALASIRLDATARVVAGVLMPVRFFAEGLVWAVAAPAAVIGVLQDDSVSRGSAAFFVFIAFVALTLSTRRAIRLYLERCRVASEYRRGLAVVEPRRGLLEMTEGGLRAEFALASVFSLGACALGFGVGLALSGNRVDNWPLGLMLAGGFVAYAALDLVRMHARKRHPMR